MSAIIVTRGDVELDPIYGSIPDEWEVVVWDNGKGRIYVLPPDDEDPGTCFDVPDLSVYGRYAAIQYASHETIFCQDDDCIIENPGSIHQAWVDHLTGDEPWGAWNEDGAPGHLVANMPQEFRPHYPDSCLVGFGACFHRDLPERAFSSLRRSIDLGYDEMLIYDHKLFARTADVVFTTLTPRVLVDVPVEVLPYAHDSNRMWKQPDHFGERTRVLEMARKVRDA